MDFIKSIENNLGLLAEKEMLPMQAGDVQQTWADVSSLQKDYNYKPNTSVEKGVEAFTDGINVLQYKIMTTDPEQNYTNYTLLKKSIN